MSVIFLQSPIRGTFTKVFAKMGMILLILRMVYLDFLICKNPINFERPLNQAVNNLRLFG